MLFLANVNCQWPMGLWSDVDQFGEVLKFNQEKFSMVDGSMVGHQPTRWDIRAIKQKWLMVDERKRVMMLHSMSTSMCCATPSKLTPKNDMSCHINIHVPFHVSSFHVIQKGWSMVDGPTVGSLGLAMCYKWLPREMTDSRWFDGWPLIKLVRSSIRQWK